MFDVFIYIIGFFWIFLIIANFILLISVFIDDIKHKIKKKKEKEEKKK